MVEPLSKFGAMVCMAFRETPTPLKSCKIKIIRMMTNAHKECPKEQEAPHAAGGGYTSKAATTQNGKQWMEN